MNTKIEALLEFLIKQRKYVLLFFAGVFVLSIVIGLSYQKQIEKNQEANTLFDDAWQKVYTVIGDMQNQPGATYTDQSPNYVQAKQLYSEAVTDIDILIVEYPETVAAAKASILVATILSLSNLNNLVENQELLTLFQEDTYFDIIKKKHPNFWGAAIAMVEGIRSETVFDFPKALSFYKEALALDKKKYIGDYSTVSIAKIYDILQDKTNAIEYYSQIEEQYPESVWLSYAMGKTYLLSQESTSPDLVEQSIVPTP